ncbi:MAG: leucine-rich repeat domain-containing protein, partial [Planctomycetota bacterium]
MNQEELIKTIKRAARDGRRELDLSGENLTSLPPEIGQLRKLTVLDLQNNYLTSLPGEFAQLKELAELDLSSNDLSSLPTEIGQLINLTLLRLSYNNLTSLPGEIGQLKNLTKLELAYNSLTSLPGEIAQLKNLTELVLHDNNLTSLPDEIGQLEMLGRLYLHDNDELGIPPEVLGIQFYEYGEPATAGDIIDYYFHQRTERRRELRETKAPLPDEKGLDLQAFDVFLCHNSEDKPAVKRVGKELQTRGLKVWLDEWEVRPGLPWQQALEDQIENIKSAAVFVGDSGLGPWQNMERMAFLSEFASRKCPVIPVILKNSKKKPRLPV